MSDKPRHLSWFLGPKAENSEQMERLLLLVFRDYVHWRRNYFPADPFLLNESLRREYAQERDELHEHTQRLLALLRRNFPFYSPRYLAHELSDTLMPATIGYIAGLVYNANNVTPEAAPVTVDLEVEACAEFAKMLGYRPPPPPPEGECDLERYYAEESARGFSWSHLTSGGTLANIEALWVARDVKYFPLAVRDVAQRRDLDIRVKPARWKEGDPLSDIRAIDDASVLGLRPNECIYLLSKLVEALRKAPTDDGRPLDPWEAIGESDYALTGGVARAFQSAPPVILVSSTAHYSVRKAAQVLGMGKACVWSVPVDAQFRMSIDGLRRRIREARAKGFNPFCVIATAGTTEEGSVDPIHEIADLRTELERDESFSFWIHVDAAWGGFLRTVLCPEEEEQARAVMAKVGSILGIGRPGESLLEWHRTLGDLVWSRLAAGDSVSSAGSEGANSAAAAQPDPEPDRSELDAALGQSVPGGSRIRNRVRDVLDRMGTMLDHGAFARYVESLERLPTQLGEQVALGVPAEKLKWTFEDLHTEVTSFVSSQLTMELERYRKEYTISWPARDVCASLLRIPSADSITLDPHKMGYVPYPAGAVAYKNDRVRHFVQQKAPYITAKSASHLVHRPPIHRVDGEGGTTIHRDAFGPFILDGSRPGAAASGVWLSTRTVPLVRRGHGAIVRASTLAAKALYEWLLHWAAIYSKLERDVEFEFVPLTERAPDTNLVTFSVKKRTSRGLSAMNRFAEAIYREFTIESELGETEYSYAQPFFLSRTVHELTTYSVAELSPFATRAGLADKWKREYEAEGLVVLRASVMNPYLTPLRELGKGDLVREFVCSLARVAAGVVKEI